MSKIGDLSKKILKAREEYYNQTPTVSDAVFDRWVDELKRLDPTNHAVTMIGFPAPPSEWVKTAHKIPMGSLDKVNLPEELDDWVAANCPKEKLFVCEKLDGLSINCVYDDGKLTHTATRGNGEIGENIYANVRKMKGVALELEHFTGSLRGEIIMLKSAHKKHFADKMNPRNAAAGVSKRLDGADSQHLNVMFYQVLGDVEFKTEEEQFKWLKNHKIATPNHWLFNNVAEVNAHWVHYQMGKRDALDYLIDGLVVRIDNLAVQQELGEHDLRPKGAKAFKFENESAESEIVDIIFQVGNSGRVNPVVVVKPVLIAGAKISRASVYNAAYINELKLDIGAKVIVVRANDVIPKILSLVEGVGTVAKLPTSCPVCGGEVKMDGENLMCLNISDCFAQKTGRIKNWIAELNVLEWGVGLIDKLVESGKVTTVADLYKLKVADLAALERMGETSAKKCYETLWRNPAIPLDTFIGALSITLIGSSTIRQVMAAGYKTLESIMKLKAVDFENISGIGPARAECLERGLRQYSGVITDLLTNGVTIKEAKVGNLTGKSFVFTGTMERKRAELEQMVTDAGGVLKSSVGKGLDYLVIADPNSTSTKAVKARQLGTKLVSEEEFLKML